MWNRVRIMLLILTLFHMDMWICLLLLAYMSCDGHVRVMWLHFCSTVVSSLDDALLAAHLKRTAKWLQKCGHGNSIARTQAKGVSLNVYHDPAPQELRRARDVLLTVMSGAEKYLKEWPEHPVLNQVQFVLSVTYVHTRTHIHIIYTLSTRDTGGS